MKIIVNIFACWSLAASALAGETLTPIPGKVMAPDFSLQDTGGKTGVAGLCLGGGNAVSVTVEAL